MANGRVSPDTQVQKQMRDSRAKVWTITICLSLQRGGSARVQHVWGFNPVKFAVIQSGAKSSDMIISVSPQGVAYTGVMKNEVISPTVPS